MNKYNAIVCVNFSNLSIYLKIYQNDQIETDEYIWKEIHIWNAITANFKNNIYDTGYIPPMAVELGKASLQFGSPMLSAYCLQKAW